MEAIRADHEFAVQGAVRVLKELVRDLTDAHIPSVAPVILPDIYRCNDCYEIHSIIFLILEFSARLRDSQ